MNWRSSWFGQKQKKMVGVHAYMRDRSLTAYLNINNHYEGSAPLTIERLRGRGVTSQLVLPDRPR